MHVSLFLLIVLFFFFFFIVSTALRDCGTARVYSSLCSWHRNDLYRMYRRTSSCSLHHNNLYPNYRYGVFTLMVDRSMEALLASGEHLRPKDLRVADRWRHAAHLAVRKNTFLFSVTPACQYETALLFSTLFTQFNSHSFA
jgi:hypothetical protein